MNPTSIAATLLGLVAFATVTGLVWRRGQGRIRRSSSDTVISLASLGIDSSTSGITLLQFSSVLCSPCKAVHAMLAALAVERDGVSHVEIDLGDRPELASRFHIAQTPTTFILDGNGIVLARIGGALKRDTVTAELDSILVAA